MANVVVAQRMWQRRGSAALWASRNPVLEAGEIGVELGATNADPQKFKIGNGATPWNDLAYGGGEGGGGAGGPAPVVTLDNTTYTLAQLTPGAWHRCTASAGTEITVNAESVQSIENNAEFGIRASSTSAVTLVAASGVTIRPPVGGTLVVPPGGFVVLKRVAADSFDLVGVTSSAFLASDVAYSNSGSGLGATTVQAAIDEIAAGGGGGGGVAPVLTLGGTAYVVNGLTSGGWHVFTAGGLVTIDVLDGATAPLPPNAEFGIEARGAGGVELVAGTGVLLYAPKGGTLALEMGDFVVLKKMGSTDTFKVIGSTVEA